MNLQELKSSYLDNRSQFIIFNADHRVVESCDSLFTVSRETEVFGSNPFLESIEDTFFNLNPGEDIEYPCIGNEFFGVSGYFDLVFKCITPDRFLWITVDLTEFYNYIIPIQQQRNELDIQGEFLEIRQKAITLEKQLLQMQHDELKRIKRFKEDFFAQVSHDMRVPLNSIVGLARLMQNKKDREDLQSHLKTLIDTSDHLVSIVNDVLDLSKIEAGKITIDANPFDLKKVTDSVINSFSFVVVEKGIGIQNEISPEVPVNLIGDSKKLSQILFNLIGNSVKYTSYGQIELSVVAAWTDEKDVNLVFKIKDTGVGISKEDQENIFEPYEQGDRKKSQIYGGTGLGLNIVKKLITLQNGQVLLESELNKGTTITFNIPYKINPDPPENAGLRPQEYHPLHFIRKVLVGEDDLLNQKVINDWLLRWGLNTTLVSDGEQALNKIRETEFDMIILDYQMPGLTGLEVAQKADPHKLPPTLLLTGKSFGEKLKPANQKLFRATLTKPFDPDQLWKVIANLERERSQRKISPIDLSYLKKITDNNPDLMIELIDIFTDSAPKALVKMKKELKSENWKSLQKSLHKIIPNFEYVASKEIISMINTFEESLKKKVKKDSYPMFLNRLETSTEDILKELGWYKQNLIKNSTSSTR